jgi:hypothetical protein
MKEKGVIKMSVRVQVYSVLFVALLLGFLLAVVGVELVI